MSNDDPYFLSRCADGVYFADSFEQRKKLGRPMLAWIVILAIVATIALMPSFVPDQGAKDEAADSSSILLRLMEFQGKCFVGMNALAQQTSQEEIYKAAKTLNSGSIGQRLRFVILAGELVGPSEAADQLAVIQRKLVDSGTRPTKAEGQLLQSLQRLYEDYGRKQWSAPSLSKHKKKQLSAELDWFGTLALAPAQAENAQSRQQVLASARIVAVVFMLLAFMALAMAVAGLLGFTIFLALALSGGIRSRLDAGSRFGALYAETFAVWLLLFLALEIAATVVTSFSPQNRLVITGGAGLLSLAALSWPVLRGAPWYSVRKDLGLTLGKGVFEPLFGLVCYVSSVPLLIVGLLIVVQLFRVIALLAGEAAPADEFAPMHVPAHPIVYQVRQAGVWLFLQVLFVASFVAPIVEETMFRGVLYRHLRDASAGWRMGISIAFAALVNAVVFAIIHPQGIIAVPALTALAVGFSLAREWRGSLIAPMTMHSINNGLMTVLLFAIL